MSVIKSLPKNYFFSICCCCSVVSDSLWLHGLQHTRLPCPSPSPGVCSNSLVGDAIQPSHPLSSPSPPVFNLSEHQGLFQWVGSSTQVAKLLCWRRLLRVPWTAWRSNQSILKEINPEYSLEGLMLKLRLQYFGKELTHWKRPQCWERLRTGGEVGGRGWDGWMASPTQ